MRDRIYNKLAKELKPEIIEVSDESAQHFGHQGNDMDGESHFRIKISKSSLKELNRVKAHQRIYKILADEIKQIHALAIELI